MNISSAAVNYRTLVTGTADALKSRDNQPEDMDPAAGSVRLSRQDMAGKGLKPLQFPRENPWKDEVVDAAVKFDPASGAVSSAQVQTERYYDSSYGKSASDFYDYSLTDRGASQDFQVVRHDYWNVNNFRARGTFEKASGEITAYKYKEYAETFPQALKDVFTSPAGIGLTAFAGLLAGAPGTLTGTLAGAAFGPVGNVVAGCAGAALVAGGLAYYKTRPW